MPPRTRSREAQKETERIIQSVHDEATQAMIDQAARAIANQSSGENAERITGQNSQPNVEPSYEVVDDDPEDLEEEAEKKYDDGGPSVQSRETTPGNPVSDQMRSTNDEEPELIIRQVNQPGFNSNGMFGSPASTVVNQTMFSRPRTNISWNTNGQIQGGIMRPRKRPTGKGDKVGGRDGDDYNLSPDSSPPMPQITGKTESTKGLVEKSYPDMPKLNDGNWRTWKLLMEDYSEQFRGVKAIIFQDKDKSFRELAITYGHEYTGNALSLGYKEIHTKIYNKLLKVVSEDVEMQIAEEIKILQEAGGDEQFIRYNANILYKLLEERYGKKNKFAEIVQTFRGLTEEDMRYNYKESPQIYESRLRQRVNKYYEALGKRLPEEFMVTLMLSGIPNFLQTELELRAGMNGNKNDKLTCKSIMDSLTEIWNSKGLQRAKKRSHSGKEQNKPNGDKKANMNASTTAPTSTPVPGSPSTPKRDYSKVKCYKCQKLGHIAPKCPENKSPSVKPDGEHKNLKAKQPDKMGCLVMGQVSDPRFVNARRLYLDSGAEQHSVKDNTMLYNAEKLEEPIELIGAFGDKTVKPNVVGRLALGPNISLGNVLYCKEIRMSLISEHKLMESTQNGMIIIKDKFAARIYRPEDVEVREVNPPKLMFVKKGSFWVKDLAGASTNPADQLTDEPISYRRVPMGDDSEEEKDEQQEGRPTVNPDELTSRPVPLGTPISPSGRRKIPHKNKNKRPKGKGGRS